VDSRGVFCIPRTESILSVVSRGVFCIPRTESILSVVSRTAHVHCALNRYFLSTHGRFAQPSLLKRCELSSHAPLPAPHSLNRYYLSSHAPLPIPSTQYNAKPRSFQLKNAASHM